MVVLASFSAPTEGIKHQQPSTTLIVNGHDVGIGTLYIAESALSWRKNTTGEGISLPYTQISVHAVSRDLERFEHECLYLITDCNLDNEFGLEDEVSDEEDGEEKLKDGTEVRFVPADKGALDAMYVAMCHCQELHPDPEGFVLSEDDEEEEDEEEFLDAHEHGAANALHAQPDLPAADFRGGDSGFVEDNIIPDGSNRSNGFHRVAHDDDDGNDSAMEIDPGQFEDAED